ncbi:hypothetical protein FPOAC2_01978 [Fusarium poae]|uniref:F-box domain-containing protein n=1 Tax=Fusarium poae TaxID=36050 RepID=A0A1B8B562_FUSPO|nr:hypothetical protein FPOAC1_001891 [Fusarium poae]KAG8675896.1 hypothetical protein FPOAC1_001891 [Fusarium poae]OBS27868.1 hypothetical protein FPOA_01810 [Fusarium poae]
MENPEKSQFNLINNLPTELLKYVFSRFCFHCHSPQSINDPEVNRTYAHELRLGSANLLALSQTSKRCRRIAMPILFHQVGSDITLRYMLQVLDRDRDLAPNIKILHLPYYMTDECRSVLYKTASSFAGMSMSYRLALEDPYDVQINTLLGLASNLQALTIRFSGEGINLDFFEKTLTQRGFKARFADLRYLELEADDFVTFSAAGSGLSFLLQQSPQLETLVLRGIEQAESPSYGPEFEDPKSNMALPNLKELQIRGWSFRESCNDRHPLLKLFHRAKNLTSFKYVIDKGPGSYSEERPQVHHVAPKYLLRYLNSEKLQYLHLDFKLNSTGPHILGLTTYFDLRDPPRFESTIITREQLGRFTNLTSLTLDPLCFCRHVSEGTLDRQKFDHQKTCLTDLLTPSIRDLTLLLKGDDMRWICWDDILYLGHKAREGALPELQTVTAEIPQLRSRYRGCWDDDWNNQHMHKILKPFKTPEEEFHAAFEGSGVVAKIEGRWGGCYCGQCEPRVYVPLDCFVIEES